MSGKGTFPRDAIGVDSWANVHVVHRKAKKFGGFPDVLNLAHGDCPCKRAIGPKGIPRVYVPEESSGENTDLCPMGFLTERFCDISQGAVDTITTPQGRVITMRKWGVMPYISKREFNMILNDLPDVDVPGRSGETPMPPTAARACKTQCSLSQNRIIFSISSPT